jgi:hypothetical protein
VCAVVRLRALMSLTLPLFFLQLGKRKKSFTLHVADETFIAPSALFHPDLFELTVPRNKRVRFMEKNLGDPEDPHDHIYLSETSRDGTRQIIIQI